MNRERECIDYLDRLDSFESGKQDGTGGVGCGFEKLRATSDERPSETETETVKHKATIDDERPKSIVNLELHNEDVADM